MATSQYYVVGAVAPSMNIMPNAPLVTTLSGEQLSIVASEIVIVKCVQNKAVVQILIFIPTLV